MAGIIVGIVALPLAIAFGIASGVSPEKGLITAIIGGFIVSFLGGQQRPDRRPHGSLHRHRRRHHQPVRHRRTRHRHRHGRHHPCPARTLQTRRRHQIHPLSHHRGLHGWYCSDDILHPDKRPLRSTYRRSRPGRLHRQMGGLLPALRHHQPLGPRHRPGEHPHHSADAQGIAQDTGVARGHHPRYRRLLPAQKVLRHRYDRDHRRPLQHQPRHTGPRRVLLQSGDHPRPAATGLHHRHARRHRIAAFGHGGRRRHGRPPQFQYGTHRTGRRQHRRAVLRRYPRDRAPSPAR